VVDFEIFLAIPFEIQWQFSSYHTLCQLFCANQSDASLLPQNLEIEYLPENVTNTDQPAVMGIIASLKVGYKLSMLETLLAIFDVEGGYEKAAEACRCQKHGCKGFQYGEEKPMSLMQ
jgi:hypothetical protein